MMRPSHQPTDLELAVMALLNTADPMALDPGAQTPLDEYAPEASAMSVDLAESGEITIDQLDAIWSFFFDTPLTRLMGERELQQLQQALTAAALRYRQDRGNALE